MNKVLLSICIPTYNRADILDQSLEKLVSNIEVDDRVEIIVSDNCSTDHTAEVVKKYSKVKYYRCDEYIRFENFARPMLFATGEYLKLTNDTCFYQPGAIAFMLDMIEKNRLTKTPLYFLQNSFNYKNKVVSTNGLDEFLDTISVHITWVAVFGMWQEQFEALEDKNRMLSTLFPQTDWSLRNVLKHKQTIVCFGDYLSFVPLNKKGGYNVFHAFIVNYLGILESYVSQNNLSVNTFQKEKKRLYKYNIAPWIPLLFTNRSGIYQFEMDGSKSLIFETFSRYPYFWISLPKVIFRALKQLF